MENESNYFMLNDKAYDFFKKLVQIVIPAISALYFGLASIWGLPAAEQVVGTLAVLATFLGVILGISSRGYHESGAAYDGNLVITSPENGPKNFLLEVDKNPEEFEDKDSITFKVRAD